MERRRGDQRGGLGGIALIAGVRTPYLALAPFLLVAGSGTATVFPAVAAEVMGSVPDHQAGIASGVNNALRELGGVFGVAVLAAVFARPGVYGSPAVFTAGFRPAMWVAVVFSAAGVPLALSLKKASPAAAATAPADSLQKSRAQRY